MKGYVRYSIATASQGHLILKYLVVFQLCFVVFDKSYFVLHSLTISSNCFNCDAVAIEMKGYVRYSIATASQLKQLEEIVKEWSTKYDLSKTTKQVLICDGDWSSDIEIFSCVSAVFRCF
jgi:hypothetical protein